MIQIRTEKSFLKRQSCDEGNIVSFFEQVTRLIQFHILVEIFANKNCCEANSDRLKWDFIQSPFFSVLTSFYLNKGKILESNQNPKPN